MKIFVNTIVNNEENFIWFAIMSVVDYVDKVIVWDTGSTDRTIEIIKEIKKNKGKKISLKKVGKVDSNQFTEIRQKMLDISNCDWILILDGDEVWWEKSIKDIVKCIKKRGDQIAGIVVPVTVSIGDIYHFQDESAGRYKILGRKGHYNLRAINKKIPGLHLDLPHPLEGYFDAKNKLIQERKDTIFLDAPYLHVTHLRRSSSVDKINKFKFEVGNVFTKSKKIPEIFYKPFPNIVSSPWVKMRGKDLFKAKLLTPLRKIKRRII